MKKTIFYVGLMIALLAATMTVQAQEISEYQTISPAALAERSSLLENKQTPPGRMVPTTIYETTHDGGNAVNISPQPGNGTSEYIRMAGANRSITEIGMFVFDFSGTLAPYDITISIFSACNTSGANGSSCNSGPGVLVPGSTQTITVTPSTAFHEVVFNYTGLDVSSETDNELLINLVTTRPDIAWIIGNSGRTVGSRTLQEDGFGVDIFAACGRATGNGCTRFFGPVPPNPSAIMDLRVVADEVVVATPPNDLCINAEVIQNDGTFPGTSNFATNEVPAPPVCGTSVTAPGVWYKFTDISGTGVNVTASVCVANYDTKIHVYSGSCDMLTCVGSNDDFCGLQSEFSWMTDGSSEYLILVSGFGAATGNFELELTGLAPGIYPLINCPGDITIDAAPGACEANYGFATPTALDPEGGSVTVTQTMGPVSPGPFPVGDTIVEFTATNDAAPNETTTCRFTVTVVDNQIPTLTCPADISQSNDPGVCEALVPVPQPTINDNCPDDLTNLVNDYNGTNDASGVYPVGTTVVTWTYTDAGGNSADCTMDVVVTDDEAPEIVCVGGPGVGSGSATGTGAAIPDADPVGLTTTLDITDDFNITDLDVDLDINHTWVGDLIVTLTAPDGTTSAAIIDRPGFTGTGFGCSGNDILATLDDEAATAVEDECAGSVPTIAGSFIPNEALSVFDGMSTLGTWTLNVSDNGGGDTGTLNAWTLNYSYDVATSPPFNVILDANGMATVNVADLLVSATDNCGAVTATTDVTGIAASSITTVFDSNNGLGGGSAVYFDVTVGANDIEITDLDLNTGDPGAFTVEMYTLVGTYVGNTANPAPWTLSATGAGTASGTVNVPSNAVLDASVTLTAGTTYGVALVMDATHGHSYSGTGTNPAPGMLMYSNADVTLNLGASSAAPFAGTAFSPRIWNGRINYLVESTTPVPVESFMVDCEDVGEMTVEVTVTDTAGNTSMCTATINVIDNIDPILVCKDFTLELGADGTAMLDPMDLIDMDLTFEACGLSVDAVSMDDFDCDDIGTPQTVTLFVSDPSGNLASCTATVTVVDLLAPVVTCPADMTIDPGAGTQLYEVPDYFADGLATALDNCTDPVTLFTQDPVAGSFLGDGVYTVTLSATDEYGNIGTCTFELTIESVLGVDDNSLETGITLYPNPAQNQVVLSNASNILLNKATMYDVNGKLMNTVDLTNMSTEKTIDISKLASGVYIVQIESENASVVKRLIKE